VRSGGQDLTKEQRRLYESTIAYENKKADNSLRHGADPSEVTAKVLHALRDPYPRTRYLAAKYNGKPIAVIRALAYLPDRVHDALKLAPDIRNNELRQTLSPKARKVT
jgi:hypothetical protein